MSDSATIPAVPSKKSVPSIAAAILLAFILLFYMFSFVVRWQEAAIVTTFGRAGEGSQESTPGLHFKWPWPVQHVYTYDLRLRTLESTLTETKTADNKTLLISVAAVWQINKPTIFFKSLKTEAEAEKYLRGIISARTNDVVGSFPLSQFVNTDPAQMRLPKIEDEILSRINQTLKVDGTDAEQVGIRVAEISLRRVGLSPKVTEAVFDRMKKERQKLAEIYRSEGNAIAEAIKSKAEQQASIIKSFAERLATNISSQGNRDAAQFYRVFERNPEFAAFLQQLAVTRETLKNNTVFILDASSFGGTFGLLGEALSPSATTKPAAHLPAVHTGADAQP